MYSLAKSVHNSVTRNNEFDARANEVAPFLEEAEREHNAGVKVDYNAQTGDLSYRGVKTHKNVYGADDKRSRGKSPSRIGKANANRQSPVQTRGRSRVRNNRDAVQCVARGKSPVRGILDRTAAIQKHEEAVINTNAKTITAIYALALALAAKVMNDQGFPAEELAVFTTISAILGLSVIAICSCCRTNT